MASSQCTLAGGYWVSQNAGAFGHVILPTLTTTQSFPSMRSYVVLFTALWAVVTAASAARAADKDQFKVPLGLKPVPVPADNPMTPEKVELGKQLYFDPRLSYDDTVSCASCHDPKK